MVSDSVGLIIDIFVHCVFINKYMDFPNENEKLTVAALYLIEACIYICRLISWCFSSLQ